MVFKKREGNGSQGRPRRRWPLLAVLLVVLAIGAYLAYRGDVDVPGALHLARTASTEAATTAKVKAAFALSSKVSAFDIDVDTQGGIVRLRGEVPSDEIRELAVAIAADTSGVTRVEDQLLVDPSTRPSPELAELRSRVRDLELQTAIESAIRRSPDLREEDLVILVDKGHVKLSGTVTGPAHKYGAERVVASVDGVAEIESSIEVLSPETDERLSEGADVAAELAKRVEFELFASGAFDLERLSVRATRTGSVTLTGEVRSHAEKLLAERLARDVEGVDEVVNDLEALFVPRQADSGSTTEESMKEVEDIDEHQ